MNKKVLITSVGSLVGQNILDSLENRRQNITLIGTNSVADVPNNFRCDSCYLVAPFAQLTAFTSDLLKVIQNENPDVILAGRDDDVVVLGMLAKQYPAIQAKFIGGAVEFAKSVDDKVLSYQFAKKHHLPFAITIESGNSDSFIEAKKLVATYGFPLIAKPSKGNGSRGIFIVLEEQQLQKVAAAKGYSLQPFFRSATEASINLDTSFGVPFFWEVPENSLYAAQVMITKNGEIEDFISFVSFMVYGKCERMTQYNHPELTEIIQSFARAAVEEGWRGPFNIQFKKDEKHGFQAVELNGRFSGGTSARLHFGFDEVGRAINDWTGEEIIPNILQKDKVSFVIKSLTDYPVYDLHAQKLAQTNYWTKY